MPQYKKSMFIFFTFIIAEHSLSYWSDIIFNCNNLLKNEIDLHCNLLVGLRFSCLSRNNSHSHFSSDSRTRVLWNISIHTSDNCKLSFLKHTSLGKFSIYIDRCHSVVLQWIQNLGEYRNDRKAKFMDWSDCSIWRHERCL